jgi:hypothetical protein
MQKRIAPLIALACLTALAQVTILETETVEITTKLVRVATTFRNDTVTGELAGADVDFVRVKQAGTNVLSITPGPSLRLTPAQITNVLTTFSASQAALDAALAQMLTNAP